jgi:GNAT superfamily N-acetyltransferase
MWTTRYLTDKGEILHYLETDRLYAAYAIGDLDPVLFGQSSWTGASSAGKLHGLSLRFEGLTPPPLFLMGEPSGLRAILEDDLRSDDVYLTCRRRHLAMVCHFFAWDRMIPMWRMSLQPDSFSPLESSCSCIRLAPTQTEQLTALYSLGGADAFSPTQVEHGIFYGVQLGGDLVAAAGTHLISTTYGVAALGNVFTHPNHRRRGYGMAAIGAVVGELVDLGISDIVLNVSQVNAAAIRVYERFGFAKVCPFLEGPAHPKLDGRRKH